MCDGAKLSEHEANDRGAAAMCERQRWLLKARAPPRSAAMVRALPANAWIRELHSEVLTLLTLALSAGGAPAVLRTRRGPPRTKPS